MIKRALLAGALGSMLALVGVTPNAALAEAAEDAARPIDWIVVVAPRIRQERDRVGASRVTTISRDIRVDFGDLDLTRTSNLYLLEDRVNEAAREVCEELAELFPDAQPTVAVCIRRAVEDAMVQVRQAARQAVAG
ncbi:MAG: UrcA family protein [Gammaproteobacteria bacterium]|nr:MAG: UrcA family protein [Gammaproteobacteria bacterium]